MTNDSLRVIWQATLLSLQIAIVATVLTAGVAIPLAYAIARRPFRGRSLVESLLTLPLVLPPTVVGYVLIVLLGRNGWIGRPLMSWFGVRLIFDWRGAVIASVVVSFPLLFLPAKSAFASVPGELMDVATLMGAGRWRTFWHVALPLARPGIFSGLLLAFARSLGEFGATVMVLGDQTNHQTLPISIYSDFVSGGSFESAAPAVWSCGVLAVISLGVVLIYNRVASKISL